MADDLYHIASGSSLYAGIPRGLGNIGNFRIALEGQSNQVGSALQSDLSAEPLATTGPELAALMNGTFDRVYMRTANGSSFVKLSKSNNGAIPDGFGPEFGLAVQWMRQTTSGILFLEKWASGGQSITYFDPAGSPYNVARIYHNNGSAWLATNGYTLAGDSWLWVQGESDASQTQAWYQSRLEALMAARVADGLQPVGAISVIAQMKNPSATYGAGVDAAKAAIAAADPARRKLVRMDHYRADNIHCNGRGQLKLAYDSFAAIFGTPVVGV